MELQARLATLQAEQAALPRQVARLEARLAAEREQLQRQQASEQQGPATGACEVQAATGVQVDQLCNSCHELSTAMLLQPLPRSANRPCRT